MNGVQALTVGCLGLFLALGALVTAGASWYDVGQAERRRRLAQQPHRRRIRRRPLITLIVLANQDGAGLKDCLFSIGNSYRKYGITVVAPARNQVIKQALGEFKAAYPSKKAHLTIGSGPDAAIKAVKRSKGELVTVLNRPMRLAPAALKNAADQFALDPKLDGLIIQQAILPQPSLVNLVRRFRLLGLDQVRKAASAFGAARLGFVILPSAVYQRRLFINRAHGSLGLALGLTKGLRLAVSLAALALAAYGIYLAAASVTVYLLAIVWSGLLIFLLLAVWGDDNLNLAQKSRMTLLIPAVSGLLYLDLLANFLVGAAKAAAARI